MLTIRNISVLFVSAATVSVEERRRGSAAGDGEVRAGEEPSHPRAEEDPQRGPVTVQQPPCPQR